MENSAPDKADGGHPIAKAKADEQEQHGGKDDQHLILRKKKRVCALVDRSRNLLHARGARISSANFQREQQRVKERNGPCRKGKDEKNVHRGPSCLFLMGFHLVSEQIKAA